MRGTIAVVGAGILGRLCAWYLTKRHWKVTLFDSGDSSGYGSCSYVATGILGPFSGYGVSVPLVRELGIESLRLWPHILQEVGPMVYFQQSGTLMLLKGLDTNQRKFQEQKYSGTDFIEQFQLLDAKAVKKLEPELRAYRDSAYFFPMEAQVDCREALVALGNWTLKNMDCHYAEEVIGVEPYHVLRKRGGKPFDWVLDTRGWKAKSAWEGLRGVRGESILVNAKDVHLTRSICMSHEGQTVYVVPKRAQDFVVASTSIETESLEPISVDSTLKLLAGACAIHPNFKTAQIIENRVNLRPALEDGLPKIKHEPGLIRVNGLYRHGFLMAPRIAFAVSDFIDTGTEDLQYPTLFPS